VATEVAFMRRVLEEDLRLHAGFAATGLPLDPRDELHLRSDRMGVALRRALFDFSTAGRVSAAA
jgi:hypothetical protein